MPHPDEMPQRYVSWLGHVGEFVRRPDLFGPNPEVCDIWEDSDAVEGFDNFCVIQFCIRTAVYQLEAALAIHAAGAPPSAGSRPRTCRPRNGGAGLLAPIA